MYCANCGVKLADTEKRCPLCGTAAYHPEIERPEVTPLFPNVPIAKQTLSKTTIEIIILILFLIPIFTTAYCDYMINSNITWSGYVTGAMLLIYIIAVLPTWFRRATPAIFVPCDFLAIALYLHYINFITGGDWFLSLAFPLILYLGLALTAFTVLLYYLKRGKLYIIGSFFIVMAVFMAYIEFFVDLTFNFNFSGWSIYPIIPLFFIGLGLILIAISRNAKAALARKLHF